MDDIGFWLGKLVWAIFSPAHFIVILFVFSFFLSQQSFLKSFIRGITALFFLIALLFPIGDWALLPLEKCGFDQGMPMRVDGVIILGGAVDTLVSDQRHAITFNGSAERIFALLKLIKQYPSAQFIYTGGSNSLKQGSPGEAEYVKQFLDDMGMRPPTMAFESHTRNTYEDALMNKDIYGKTPKQNWLLVTSAFHMPRTYGLFQKLAQKTDTLFYPYTVDYKTFGNFKFELRMDMLQTLLKFDLAAHEYVGLLFNMLLKRSDSYMSCNAQSQILQ
ncbi:MAG: YdcF family protein [Alphaproteobacteria bacterium]|nr:YdcF family protein [Alphaproteobacteria bacterium]